MQKYCKVTKKLMFVEVFVYNTKKKTAVEGKNTLFLVHLLAAVSPTRVSCDWTLKELQF